jgi:phosphatidylinositol-3-phosphatase
MESGAGTVVALATSRIGGEWLRPLHGPPSREGPDGRKRLMGNDLGKAVTIAVVLLGSAVVGCSSSADGVSGTTDAPGTLELLKHHPPPDAGDAGNSDSSSSDAASDDSSADGSSDAASDSGTADGGSDAPVESGTPDSGTDSGSSGSVIKKVFYLMEENRNSNQVYGASDAPYINNVLMPTYDYASNYTDVVHPSEPNYVWLEAGFDMGLLTDNDPTSSNSTNTTDHIVNYLGRVGKTWKSYQENLPGSCGIFSSGQYAAKHNPFVFFQDVVGSYSNPSAFCLSHIVDLTVLSTDIANRTLADFIEITPNLCNDGHDCANPTVEAFLQNSTIQAVFNYVLNANNHAILVIDWDEGEGQGIHPMLLIAPTSTLSGGHNIATQVDHSSFVRSMQMIFGVDPTHIDPTTGLAFSWLRNASTANNFSTFFAPGQFP